MNVLWLFLGKLLLFHRCCQIFILTYSLVLDAAWLSSLGSCKTSLGSPLFDSSLLSDKNSYSCPSLSRCSRRLAVYCARIRIANTTVPAIANARKVFVRPNSSINVPLIIVPPPLPSPQNIPWRIPGNEIVWYTLIIRHYRSLQIHVISPQRIELLHQLSVAPRRGRVYSLTGILIIPFGASDRNTWIF